VNGLPSAVDLYPSYLNAMFDPDFVNYGPDLVPFSADDVNGPVAPVMPLQRLRAGALLGGAGATEINLVTFAPGALAAAFAAPHPYADLTMDMGYTTLTVVDDPTQPISPTAITDSCTDDWTLTTIWGEAHANPCNAGVPPAPGGPCDTPAEINDPFVGPVTGQDRARTPPAVGTYLYVTYSQTYRDADEDGLENRFDTCAHGGGPLGGCDPAPAVDVGGGNADGDAALNGFGWLNAADNCPLVANAVQLEGELDNSYYEAFATNPAPQGGPKVDEIGDACDLDVVAPTPWTATSTAW
jgi:hypothetical protein